MKALFCLALFVGAAHAEIIYDNGAPDYSLGVIVDYGSVADDFQLAQRTEITGVRYWTFEFVTTVLTEDTVQWWIYADENGNPGSSLASGTASQTGTLLPGTPTVGPGSNFLTEFSLGSPVTLDPGTYWLALYEHQVSWLSTPLPTTGADVEAQFLGSPFAPIPAAHGMAFQLLGQPAAGTAVPEPSSGLLFLGAAAWIARRAYASREKALPRER